LMAPLTAMAKQKLKVGSMLMSCLTVKADQKLTAARTPKVESKVMAPSTAMVNQNQ